MARGDGMRRANEVWRKRLSDQRDALKRSIADRDPAPPKDFGDYVFRKVQDKRLGDLDGAIQEIDDNLAQPDTDDDDADES